jgi:fumarate reductase flavoprotein subunit
MIEEKIRQKVCKLGIHKCGIIIPKATTDYADCLRKRMDKILILYFIALLVSGCSKPQPGNPAVIYKEGTYSASTEGYGGNLTLEVDFSGHSILAIRVTEHNETRGIGDQAIDFLPDEMIAAQSWDVDTVTGATITSKAIKTAIKNCIEQARVENKGEE